jgi:hypothetical protein
VTTAAHRNGGLHSYTLAPASEKKENDMQTTALESAYGSWGLLHFWQKRGGLRYSYCFFWLSLFF